MTLNQQLKRLEKNMGDNKMITYSDKEDWNPQKARNIVTLTFTYQKQDRQMMYRIRKLIELLVDKRNTEEELQKEMTIILDECMRDYYGELKEEV